MCRKFQTALSGWNKSTDSGGQQSLKILSYNIMPLKSSKIEPPFDPSCLSLLSTKMFFVEAFEDRFSHTGGLSIAKAKEIR